MPDFEGAEGRLKNDEREFVGDDCGELAELSFLKRPMKSIPDGYGIERVFLYKRRSFLGPRTCVDIVAQAIWITRGCSTSTQWPVRGNVLFHNIRSESEFLGPCVDSHNV